MSIKKLAIVPVAILLMAAAFATGTVAATLGQGARSAGAGDDAGIPGSGLMAGGGGGGGAAGGGAQDRRAVAPELAEEWLMLVSDTIRYRVCKDLTICYLQFTSPMAEVVGTLPPSPALAYASPVGLAPIHEPVAVAGDRRWALLALPLAGGLITWGRRGSSPPGTEPTNPEPPQVEPPPVTPPGEPPATVIPEPASMVLLGTGLAGLALHRRRKRLSTDQEENAD